MADQIGECNANNTELLKDAFDVTDIKVEERQDEDFADDKVQVSETAIITKAQDNLIRDKIKQYDISTTLANIKAELFSSEVQDDMIYHNLEEGISPNNIKIESNNGLLYCEDCRAYYVDYCAKCKMLVHILNETVPIDADNKLCEELPHDILEIRDYFGEFRIFALKLIPVGVRFGPFIGLNRTECSWKIKGGKFVANNDKSKYLNWMQYVSTARNISEQNLRVFQYEHNLYYESTRRIEEGDELLVHFGEEYEDSLNRNIEVEFIPTTDHIFKDAFACTFCCLGFSSKSYLAKHKTICPAAGEFTIEDVIQCPSCKIHLDQKEYITHHITYCCEINDRKCIPPRSSNRTPLINGRKTAYKCEQCKYRTKYKGDIKNHTNQHYKVKMFKCGVCCRRFKTKVVLRLHNENAHVSDKGKNDLKHFSQVCMQTHIKRNHSCSQDEIKQFKCSLCEFQTKYNKSLKRHMEIKHLKEFKYKCDTCDYKTNIQTCLNTHLEARHLKYKCDTCDYKTDWKNRLNIHIETKHLKEFKYKCDMCDYKGNYKCYLKTHMETRHLKEFKFKCDRCDYKANSKSHLKSHIKTRHLKKYKYKCDTCEYKTNKKASLTSHVESRHLQEFKYKCDICDYKASVNSNLIDHVKAKHLKEFKYKCDKCDYETNVKSHLKGHIAARHLRTFKYNCDACDYKTNQKSHLENHIDTRHLKEFKYKCDMCDYKANWQSNLKRHIETKHLKEFKFKCDTCDYKASCKSNLIVHVKTKHLNEFKYKCDSCDYQTNMKCHLNSHIEARHLKAFKYKCEICDFKANQKSNFIAHLKTKHLNEFKYKCETCGYTTNFTTNLRRHMKSRHL